MQSLILPPREEPKAFSAPQRFSFDVELTTSTSPRKYRAGWISDAHLGTRGANAGALLAFLREHDFETLYLVGDLIDIWSMRRGRYWPQQHNDVIQKILRKARKGTRVVIFRAITTNWSATSAAATATSTFGHAPSTSSPLDSAFSSSTGTRSIPSCKT
jgi:hypothetical protein